jgi:hypothetical protein
VASAYAIALWLAFIPNFIFCFRGTDLSFVRDVLAVLWPPAACTLTACLAATALQPAVLPDLVAGPARLIVRLTLATIPYGLGTVWLTPLANEGWHKLRKALGNRAAGRRFAERNAALHAVATGDAPGEER